MTAGGKWQVGPAQMKWVLRLEKCSLPFGPGRIKGDTFGKVKTGTLKRNILGKS